MKLSIRGKRVNRSKNKQTKRTKRTNRRIRCVSYGGSCDGVKPIYSTEHNVSYKKQIMFDTSIFNIILEKYNSDIQNAQAFKLTMQRISKQQYVIDKIFTIYFLAQSNISNQQEQCTHARCYTILYSQTKTQNAILYSRSNIFSILDNNLNNTIQCPTLENIVAGDSIHTKYTFNCSDFNKELFITLTQHMITCLKTHLNKKGVNVRL
jgi:hypothetical protein